MQAQLAKYNFIIETESRFSVDLPSYKKTPSKEDLVKVIGVCIVYGLTTDEQPDKMIHRLILETPDEDRSPGIDANQKIELMKKALLEAVEASLINQK